ncbi:MAG: hypothetical protein EOP48_09385 [Sphingobacteriales bacterium]|nr:MAG: hypothetical protein EOP48_09385 [Sphingobacteriales bacterium]
MKILISFLCFLLVHSCVFSQKDNLYKDDQGNVTNYGVVGIKSKVPLFLEVDRNTKFISPFNQLPNDSLGRMIFLAGTKTAKVTTRVLKDSLKYYRYSVIENDTVIKAWNEKLIRVDLVWNERSSWPGYLTMDLGIEDVENKKIIVKLYRLPKVEEVSTAVIYNKTLPELKISKAWFWNRIGNPYHYDNLELKGGERLQPGDSTVGIFITKPKTDLDFVQHVLLKHIKDGKTYIRNVSNNWRYNGDDAEPSLLIEPSNFSTPGEYEILLQNYIEKYRHFKPAGPISVLKFTVASPPRQFSKAELLGTVFLIVALAIVIILIIRRSNKKKQIQLSLKAEAAKSELSTVRSQLNPHFVFNALSGIQNLMNKHEVEQANNYLKKFSNLTREVLNERELITIEDEIKLLQNYLDMEHLRFPFTFELNVDQSNDFLYTEIPAMLLQPFVENAVKHGVASLQSQGKIAISIRKEKQDVVLNVSDNGRGFDPDAQSQGLGLKLGKKRIELLNRNYENCMIVLNIEAGAGTFVRITLTNWLA